MSSSNTKLIHIYCHATPAWVWWWKVKVLGDVWRMRVCSACSTIETCEWTFFQLLIFFFLSIDEMRNFTIFTQTLGMLCNMRRKKSESYKSCKLNLLTLISKNFHFLLILVTLKWQLSVSIVVTQIVFDSRSISSPSYSHHVQAHERNDSKLIRDNDNSQQPRRKKREQTNWNDFKFQFCLIFSHHPSDVKIL